MRIQAHFRGRKVRSRVKISEPGLLSDNTGTGSEAFPMSSVAGQRTARSEAAKNPLDANIDLLSAGDVRKAISLASLARPGDYDRLVSVLEERPSRWPKRQQRWRIVTYLMLEEPRTSRAAQALSMVILVCIIVSITAFMLETMPELKRVPPSVWDALEVISTVVFTFEYIARLLVCDVGGTTVWKFIRAPMNLIDLASILPFYLWLCFSHIEISKALGILRTVRLVRLFRIFKLGRYSSGLQLMIVALRNSSHALWVLSFFLGIGVVLFSSAIYYVEKMGCPERDDLVLQPMNDGTNRTQLDHYIEECRRRPGRENKYGICCNEYDSPLDFPTIIEAFWWSIVTMTTVGFGDVRPRTPLGKMVGTMTMLSGILLIALPIAIIGRKFQEAFLEQHQSACVNEGSDGGNTNEAPGHLSMTEMSRRLKFMRLTDSRLANLARELAEGLEEVGSMQKEIASTEAFEQDRQLKAVESFGTVITQLHQLSKSRRTTFSAGAFQGTSKIGTRHTTAERAAKGPQPRMRNTTPAPVGKAVQPQQRSAAASSSSGVPLVAPQRSAAASSSSGAPQAAQPNRRGSAGASSSGAPPAGDPARRMPPVENVGG